MRLKRALSQIRPTGDQREKIYGDILDKLSEETPEEEKETRFVMKKRKFFTSALACALVLICGITVSAANFGWGHKLFGNTASLVEKKFSDYSVDIGNVKIENAEGVPYIFTIGDVITDGSTLYFNLLVENASDELDEKFAVIGGGFSLDENSSSWDSFTWKLIDKTENAYNTAVYAKYRNNLKKGDVLEFEFKDDSRRRDFLNHIDEAENKRALLATVSFEIQSEINYMQKTIDVNRTAIFKDRPDPEFAECNPYDIDDKMTAYEIHIDTVTVSPFCLEIRGTSDSDYGNSYSGWGNIWFIYKNGARKCFQPNEGRSYVRDGYRDIYFYCDFSNSHGGTPMGVQELNEIEAIEFDSFTVPFNTETEE